MPAPSRRKQLCHLIMRRRPLSVLGALTALTMGPFETQPLEEPETVLHDLAHWVLLGASPTTAGSDVMWATHPYEEDWLMDLWELRALAVEYAIGEKLGLPLYERQLAGLFIRGAKCEACRRDPDLAETLVVRFAHTKRCQRAANTIINFLQYGQHHENTRQTSLECDATTTTKRW